MKLNEYVAERIEGLFEEVAEAIGAGEVALDDFTAEEHPAVVTMLMLDVLPRVMRVVRVGLGGGCG